jgi:hypothetical protein
MKNSLSLLLLAILLNAACRSSKSMNAAPEMVAAATDSTLAFPSLTDTARSLMELPQTQDGGFVLMPGFFETVFNTYCLQPGTPDPRPGDAYLQGPVTGKRKELVQSILLNSRYHRDIPQRHIQLLLWSVVSGADFDKLSYDVRSDAMKLLTPAQVFQLKGGIGGVLKELSRTNALGQGQLKKMLELGSSSYETYERIAVLQQPSRIVRKGVSVEQWYRHEQYYIRYLPLSYQRLRIQVFVPAAAVDTANKCNGEYLVFDPTGLQAIPAFTNAQRLGIGAPVVDILRKVIRVEPRPSIPPRAPKKGEAPAPDPKKVNVPAN